MGKKYNVYDEDGNLIAEVEKREIHYDTDDMPFLSLLLYEVAIAFMGVLFTPYSIFVVPYFAIFITSIYVLFVGDDNGATAFINGIIISVLHLAAFIAVIVWCILSDGLAEIDGEVLSWFLYFVCGAILSFDVLVSSIKGLVMYRKPNKNYELKHKRWIIEGVVGILSNLLFVVFIIIYACVWA